MEGDRYILRLCIALLNTDGNRSNYDGNDWWNISQTICFQGSKIAMDTEVIGHIQSQHTANTAHL